MITVATTITEKLSEMIASREISLLEAIGFISVQILIIFLLSNYVLNKILKNDIF